MKKIIEWFIYSSKDPEKLALTVRGIIGFIGTIAVAFGFSLTGLDINSLIGNIVDIFVNIATLITTIIAGYGFIRKLVITLKEFYNNR